VKNSIVIPTEIVPSVNRIAMAPRQVEREFNKLVSSGLKIRVAGTARQDPTRLFSAGLRPKHKIALFDTVFYLTNARQIPELRFYVGYVVQPNSKSGKLEIFPRVFYKDLSLAWRSASHFTLTDDEIWVGKGDVREEIQGEHEMVVSDEATTDLPLEMQTAMESLLAYSSRATGNGNILELVLRKSPGDRLEPYRDFLQPRQQAAANPRNLIYGGRSIARFRRKNDPTSLKIVKGFEPDFTDGVIEKSVSKSKLYGGKLRRFRILSTNRKVQYYFIAGPKHAWIFPPQAMTTELSSYGVRTISVVADDDLFVPGYEYHHYEETKHGVELYSQIPNGFAGEFCPADDAKADASPWLDQIPVIRQFRSAVLKE
jgi:hypothetical protein